MWWNSAWQELGIQSIWNPHWFQISSHRLPFNSSISSSAHLPSSLALPKIIQFSHWKSVLRSREITASTVHSWTKLKLYHSHKSKDTVALWREGSLFMQCMSSQSWGQKGSQIHLMHFCEDHHTCVIPNGCLICSQELPKIVTLQFL